MDTSSEFSAARAEWREQVARQSGAEQGDETQGGPAVPGERWQSFAAYLRATQRDNVTRAALGLLERTPVAHRLGERSRRLAEYLGRARHLLALATEAAAAEHVRQRADELSAGAGGGLWSDVSAAAAGYAALCDRVRDSLTAHERDLFSAAHQNPPRQPGPDPVYDGGLFQRDDTLF
ncbi:hypothetical protein [Streptomyces aidingensis]|uniref:Uncharacterized protein n=1 Tax=Streptomyces aidingensis TaxID=910347 RepID=A0A1I1UR79_9ACTN|nr:hypothetical protein [Streptomyces aidingensis]SFD73204.1 hypothetical protein SAMN05421773_12622 [Streptomyces aidingensis]